MVALGEAGIDVARELLTVEIEQPSAAELSVLKALSCEVRKPDLQVADHLAEPRGIQLDGFNARPGSGHSKEFHAHS